jgi:hypothetical protein
MSTRHPDQAERVVLGLLLERHPAPTHMTDVERELGSAILAAARRHALRL